MSAPEPQPRRHSVVRIIDRPTRRRRRARTRTNLSGAALAPRTARSARRAANATWVSKTDLTRYLRCPFAFYHLDRGTIAPEEAFGPQERELIEDGNAFHAAVEALAKGAPAPPVAATLDAAIATDITVVGPGLLWNPELRIRGIPDQIIPAGGDLLPVEIKGHRDIQRSDELELAFYWLLLDPHRRQPAGQPRGQLILRREGQPVIVDIDITAERIAEVHELIDEIRHVRRHGVRPRLCKCAVCTGPLRDEVTRVTRERHDLTLIWGIDGMARHLEAVGIHSYDDLRSCDPVGIASVLRACGVCVSPRQITRWLRHVESYDIDAPVAFGPPPAVGSSFIALDVEYDPQVPPIWLTGLLIFQDGHREHVSLWADDPRQEQRALQTLLDVCAAHPDLPVVTWNGSNADFPQLRGAAERHGSTDAIQALERHHIDVYHHVVATIRLPIPRLGLNDVAAHLGVPKSGAIIDGRHALSVYRNYTASADPARRAHLRDQLTAYNHEDLSLLVDTLARLRALYEPRCRIAV